MQEPQKMLEEEQNFVSFFRNSPLYGLDLHLSRDPSPMREINLDKDPIQD